MSRAKNAAWVWIELQTVVSIHEEQLAEHGGAAGVRDLALLESGIARPKQSAAYGAPDAADLAASYGFGLARNHAFVDGNKRSAFVALELFLELKGCTLNASDADCVVTMLALAAGELEEAALADWVRRHASPS